MYIVIVKVHHWLIISWQIKHNDQSCWHTRTHTSSWHVILLHTCLAGRTNYLKQHEREREFANKWIVVTARQRGGREGGRYNKTITHLKDFCKSNFWLTTHQALPQHAVYLCKPLAHLSTLSGHCVSWEVSALRRGVGICSVKWKITLSVKCPTICKLLHINQQSKWYLHFVVESAILSSLT